MASLYFFALLGIIITMYMLFNGVSVRVVALVAICVVVATHFLVKVNGIRVAINFCVLSLILLLPTTGNNSSEITLNLRTLVDFPLSSLLNIALFIPFTYYMCLTIKWQWCIIICVLFSLFVELAQLGINGRVCDLSDFVANSIGVLTAVAMHLLINATTSRRQK